MEVTGKIKVKNEAKLFGKESNFKKQDVVVTTDEQYPQDILVEFTQDKCDLLNNYSVGDEVKISINLRGREWINPQGEAKYFNSIQGWRIEKVEVQTPPPLTPVDGLNQEEEDFEGLPF